MIGVPDYETYVAHRRANHPREPIMTYVEFFREPRGFLSPVCNQPANALMRNA
jgi:Selenoprotein, putative